MTKRISVARLRERLAGRDEFALLDVREQGVHYQGHPFFAASLPLSRLELMIEDLVPRRSAPLVLLDGGDEDLAERSAAKLAALGYTNLSILDSGCKAWQAAGGELFSGVNVPSKAFGEFIEHHYDTPRIPPEELKRLKDAGRKLVILDSRPFDEFHRMNIPGGIDAPGAELLYRVHELAPEPDTLVVVNCAGRTRSIIGCQSLRNAGIPNSVVALKDGTMGWELAGFECEHGSTNVAPPPSAQGLAAAQAAAAKVAAHFRVKFATRDTVQVWQQDEGRTLYLLDVRTREEFEKKRIAGSRHAPGGQLVQATDEYVGVRNARIVLIDPARVRSVMTASWLNQMGWDDVHVLEPEGADGFAGWEVAHGPREHKAAGFVPAPTIVVGGNLQQITTARERVFLFARALKIASNHLAPALRARPEDLDDALLALLQGHEARRAGQRDPRKTQDLRRSLLKAVPRRWRDEVESLVLELAGTPDFSSQAVPFAIAELGDRTALTLTGDVPSAVNALLKMAGHDVPAGAAARVDAVRQTPEAWAVVCFSISDAHFEARTRAGVDP